MKFEKKIVGRGCGLALLACLFLLIWWSPVYAGLNDGLLAYYPFNGNANDESGNGNNGAVYGAILTEDRFGNVSSAYLFDGVNDYINVGTSSTTNTSWTISLWMKSTDTSDNQYIIDARPNALHGPLIRMLNGNLNYNAYHINDYPITTSANACDGTWHHIVVSAEGTSARLYFDGINTLNPTVTAHDFGGDHVTLGAIRPSGGACEYCGLIDDLRIYDRALGAAEIMTLYNPSVTNTADITQTVCDSNNDSENQVSLKIYNPSSESFVDPLIYGNPSLNTYIIVHGWNGPGSSIQAKTFENQEWIKEMAQAIIARMGSSVNVLAFDWTALANSTTFNPTSMFPDFTYESLLRPDFVELFIPALDDYMEAGGDYWVPNGKINDMAIQLTRLLTQFYLEPGSSSGSEIHFIGHSLGAGIAAESMKLLIEEDELNPLLDINLKRLTLLDAPEDMFALLVGGKVNLADTTISKLKEHGIAIENFFSEAKLSTGGYGKPYSGIFNIRLKFPWHGKVQEWYRCTINSSDYDTDIGYPPISLTSPDDLGFNISPEDIINFGKTSQIQTVGGTIEIIDNESGELVATFEDTYQTSSSTNALKTVYQYNSYGTSWYSYSPSGSGDLQHNILGNEIITGSPIYAYSTVNIPPNTSGLSFDYFPQLWDDNDLFAISIDNTLIFNISGRSFSNGWNTTGVLDITPWAGSEVTITLSYVSEIAGNSIVFSDPSLVDEFLDLDTDSDIDGNDLFLFIDNGDFSEYSVRKISEGLGRIIKGR